MGASFDDEIWHVGQYVKPGNMEKMLIRALFVLPWLEKKLYALGRCHSC